MTKIAIKTIDGSKTLDGKPVIVEVDTTTGHIIIGGHDTWTRPLVRKSEYGYVTAPLAGMPATIAGWIWANCDRLPKHSKIGFTAAELACGYEHAKVAIDADAAKSAASLAAHKDRVRLEREWDALHNEGADGYNPYRAADLSGTEFDPRDRHYPEGA